ncbi:MAG: hypothetical protein AAGG68_08730 [Bacteroidota bacterium]
MNSSNILNLSRLPATVRQQLRDYYQYLVAKYANAEQEESQDDLFLQQFVKPMLKRTDIDVMVRQQHYKGVDKVKMRNITQSINIPQSTDELLLML